MKFLKNVEKTEELLFLADEEQNSFTVLSIKNDVINGAKHLLSYYVKNEMAFCRENGSMLIRPVEEMSANGKILTQLAFTKLGVS